MNIPLYESTIIKQPEDIFHAWEMQSLMISTKELKQILGCGINRAYDLMKCPAFPATQIGRRYYVERDALRQWLVKYQGRPIIL